MKNNCQNRRKVWVVAISIFLPILLNGCTSVGHGPWELIEGKEFDYHRLDSLRVTPSNKDSVIEIIGTPWQLEEVSNGEDSLRYFSVHRREVVEVHGIFSKTYFRCSKSEATVKINENQPIEVKKSISGFDC